MPLDCLPERLRDVENHFEDDKQYIGIPLLGKLYYWWEKKTKGWFAIGNAANRSRFSACNWRYAPKPIVTIKGNGDWRFENDRSDYYCAIKPSSYLFWVSDPYMYLSRVQYALDWHIALQWPLFFHCHYKDWQLYVGLKRDADKIYWLSLYLGKIWK